MINFSKELQKNMFYHSLTLINYYGTIYLSKYLSSIKLKFGLIAICKNEACVISN